MNCRRMYVRTDGRMDGRTDKNLKALRRPAPPGSSKNICDRTIKKFKYFAGLTLLRILKFSNCDKSEETKT